MKIMTIVGTRPEIIKLSRIIAAIDQHFEQILVHTGQNYDFELNKIFFDDLGIRNPNFYLGIKGESPMDTISKVISKVDALLEIEKPDAFLLLGDTNSCLSAMAAKRKKIPIFHIEAGNRCFDLRVPEEINRKIVDHISDINLVYTEHARRNLLNEGVDEATIFKTGSPMKEVIERHKEKIAKSEILEELKLTKGRYFVASIHREENVDSNTNFDSLINTLNGVAGQFEMPIIVSTHPRTRKIIENLRSKTFNEKIRFIKPLSFTDYIKLQSQSFCVLSDSGTITEESSILGFPAITLRQAFERQEGIDAGTLVMSGLDLASVIKSIRIVTCQTGLSSQSIKIVDDYNVENVSNKVVRIIMSYTGYVNRNTWRKN